MGVEDLENISSENKGHLKSALDAVTTWITQLTEVLKFVPNIDASFSSDASSSPLQRCLAREIFKGKHILDCILQDLSSVRYIVSFPLIQSR